MKSAFISLRQSFESQQECQEAKTTVPTKSLLSLQRLKAKGSGYRSLQPLSFKIFCPTPAEQPTTLPISHSNPSSGFQLSPHSCPGSNALARTHTRATTAGNKGLEFCAFSRQSAGHPHSQGYLGTIPFARAVSSK